MAKTFSPMLAESPSEDFREMKGPQIYPGYVSFKLDGIRGLRAPNILPGKMISRSGIETPSGYVQDQFKGNELDWLDGELVVRDQRPGLVYKDSFSAVQTQGCQTSVEWHVFDYMKFPQYTFEQRQAQLQICLSLYGQDNIKLVHQQPVRCWEEVLMYEEKALDEGYEGLIYRKAGTPYKFGRSTLKQAWMLKVVRYAYSEAEILGFEEAEANTNEATKDAYGFTSRSSHMSGMVGKGMLGAFLCRDLKTGIEFKTGIGIGLDMALRTDIWNRREFYLGKLFKYRWKPYGMDVKPRHPSWMGWYTLGT